MHRIVLCILLGRQTGGMGLAFTMPPGLVIVGQYFEKRRGLTNSILKIGGGLGALSFAPFLRYLIEELSIDGTILILSGLLFNLLPCAVLLRPLEFYYKPSRRKCIENGMKQPIINGKISDPKLGKISEAKTFKVMDGKGNNREVIYVTENDFENEFRPHHHGSYDRLRPTSSKRIRTFSTNTDFDGINVSHESQHHSSTFGKLVSTLSNSTVGLYGGIEDFGGSIASVNYKTTEKDCGEQVDRDQCCYNVRHVTCRQIMDKLLDFKLFKNKVFLILVFAGQMGIIGAAFANTYMPPYAKDIKIDPTKTSLLISITSITDLVGKFITAFVSDLDRVKRHRYLILAFSMLVFGVASQFISILTNFTSLALYCGIYGMSGGFFIAIFTVVIIDFVGIENLSSAIGITILAHGSVLAASAPLLGEFIPKIF
ncbi:hypothetical protein KUTeg_012672 [Tegillarca granosa]|uniref:Major facilitator superfamily (MFS) profile domain-containing protein n=1 Tax=Tegillarca granosa TaxID=220873 RepID=A0ABQ9F091_TEGGR|nr:hypothetical protein KUTeg_012672 [Tegillarca granosa]